LRPDFAKLPCSYPGLAVGDECGRDTTLVQLLLCFDSFLTFASCAVSAQDRL
jgi:hypothetical protein